MIATSKSALDSSRLAASAAPAKRLAPPCDLAVQHLGRFAGVVKPHPSLLSMYSKVPRCHNVSIGDPLNFS